MRSPLALPPRSRILAGLLLLSAALGAQDPVGLGAPPTESQLPSPPDAAGTRALLAEGPRVLSYSVERSEDGTWIRLRAVCETAYPVSAQALEAILEDYEGAPKVFSRIGWVKIVDRLPDGAITEQFSGVLAFGFKFYTTNRFRQTTSRGRDYIRLQFRQITSGGTMRDCVGGWALADRSSPGSPLSFLHYEISFETLAQYPGQEAAMRSFGQADILRVLRELGEAGAKAAGAS